MLIRYLIETHDTTSIRLTAVDEAHYNKHDPRHCKLTRVDDTSATPACDAGKPVRLV